MSCPIEEDMIALLKRKGLAFTRPERDKTDPTTLDFYVADFNLYIELKCFHTPRLSNQLAKVPQGATTLVLVGRDCVTVFEKFLEKQK